MKLQTIHLFSRKRVNEHNVDRSGRGLDWGTVLKITRWIIARNDERKKEKTIQIVGVQVKGEKKARTK